MRRYSTLSELIRVGMEMRLECRKCRHILRADPEDARSYVARVHRSNAYLRAHRMEPVTEARPNQTLDGCVDGVPCPICGASNWQVDPIKPLRRDVSEGDESSKR